MKTVNKYLLFNPFLYCFVVPVLGIIYRTELSIFLSQFYEWFYQKDNVVSAFSGAYTKDEMENF